MIQAVPDRVESVIQHIRDTVIPQLQEHSGFKGYIGLGDRRTGKGMAITLWGTEEQLRASEKVSVQARLQRGQIAQMAQATTVEIYEAAAHSGPLTHSASGSYARVTTAEVSPSGVQPVLDWIQGTMFPTAQGMEGFQGGYSLIDRKGGKAMAVSLWESEERLRAVEGQLNQLRAQGAQVGGATHSPTTEVYEIVVNV
jgi:heme-degrading monooxygenase HmoA